MLWAFYQTHPFKIPLPESSPGIQQRDFVFPIFMVTEVPHLLKGFLIVAILSAAMSSVSSALTSLASVSTMDFVKHFLPGRSETFFLRFSKISTVAWAAALIFIAYLSRKVDFVLNAAFNLRGLTSGALLAGLMLAVFWKRGRAISVILPKVKWTAEFWEWTLGTEIYWPWYTLIGVVITVTIAWLVNAALPDRPITEKR